MRYLLGFLVLLGLLAAPGVRLLGFFGDDAEATSGTVSFVGPDMDVTATPANTATAIGTVETCNTVALDSTLTIDIVVNAVDPADPVNAFQFVLNYDPTKVNVTAVNNAMLLTANGGAIPIDFSNPVPDSDGQFLASFSDFSFSDPGETGPGVLSRITLKGVGAGTSSLTLSSAKVVKKVGNLNLVTGATTIGSATIAVGQPCPPPPAQFTVAKEFSDNNAADVTVSLVCSSGTVANDDVTASETDPANFTISDFSAGATCTATESAPAGYSANESACVDVPLTTGACTITNTLNTAQFLVNKDFSDNNPADVTVSLVCTSGTVVNDDVTASEADPANFTVNGFTTGATCTATESAPAGYTANQSACLNVPVATGTCTIVNTLNTAQFLVSKDFSDNNPADVTISLVCGSGTVVNDDVTASESDPANFTVNGFTAGATCTATEAIPFGYNASQLACQNVPIATGSCTIVNTLTPNSAQFTVTKDFIPNSPTNVTVGLVCTSGTVVNDDVTASEADPANFTVNNFSVGTTCTATETAPPGYSVDQSACQNVPITTGTCKITNTLFTAQFLVNKDFSDNNPANVVVSLSCTSGSVVNNDVTASETDPANFTVNGFTVGTTCTASETVPAGYTADQSGCQNVPLTTGACTITNTFNTAQFVVTKDFIPNDPADVIISLVCTSGTVVNDDVTASEADPANFTVNGYNPGATCTATESVPYGYNADQSACQNVPVTVGACTITNNIALDSDGDGLLDPYDNCPFVPNPSQRNLVHPGTFAGDHCEDPDSDSVADLTDNCPNTANAGQANADGDAFGDACDSCPSTATIWATSPGDDDCDGWSTAHENLIGTDPNSACGPGAWPPDMNDDQVVDISDVNLLTPPVFFTTSGPWFPRRDLVPDGIIDIADVNRLTPPVFFTDCGDFDNDGLLNASDNCPIVPNPGQENVIHPLNPKGDLCDDPDMDLLADTPDNCPDIFNPDQQNDVHPGTPKGDHCEDPEGDGMVDLTDNCPDAVNPGQQNVIHPQSPSGDACDDPDGDSVPDISDNCPDASNPGQENNVHQSSPLGDACDDPDGDGVFDVSDNCPDTLNPGQLNAVHPQFPRGDACDDPEGDGVFDVSDNCPDAFNPGQQNFVHPGTPKGDACDDPDNDIIVDISDNCPSVPNTSQVNADGDPFGDACDNCPSVATAWVVPLGDSDCDGWTDAHEILIGTDPNSMCGIDKWPGDINNDHIVDISDVNLLAPPVFFTTSGPWFPRRDLHPDGIIDIADINLVTPPMFLATCVP